jgi:hypothetical protein
MFSALLLRDPRSKTIQYKFIIIILWILIAFAFLSVHYGTLSADICDSYSGAIHSYSMSGVDSYV